MHTPEQARELWCPLVRIARQETVQYDPPASSKDYGIRQAGFPVVGGCNTEDLGRTRVPESCRCIADKCAMWRWEHTTASVPTTTLGASGEPARTFETRTVRTNGYCGLAPIHSTT